ncbi:MAG: DNA cytosine methyltransferase [Nitrosarchaeum sp.]|nr:DNA cytosine methyltransferase [Nitrosarchaeum sp.]
MERLRALDLFSGCGGLSLGMERAGFQVVYANELNQDAALTYQKNFPDVLMDVCDIRKIEPDDVKRKIKSMKIDLIGAGPPCQGFSTLVKRNVRDPRNGLFRHLVRFVEYFAPKAFVMENVTGLLSMNKGKTIENICDEFESIGYHVAVDKLLASDFGVPQDRTRVFIIGTTKKIPRVELFPKKNGHARVSVKKAISDLSFLGIGEYATTYQRRTFSEYQVMMRNNCAVLANHESANHSERIQKRFMMIPPGMVAKKISGYDSGKRDCYKFDPSEPSKTVTTLPEDFIHYQQNRIPTVRELARLQSFPDDFVFLGPRTTGGAQRKHSCPQYTQVGNAVPPLLSQEVFANMKKILKKYY